MSRKTCLVVPSACVERVIRGFSSLSRKTCPCPRLSALRCDADPSLPILVAEDLPRRAVWSRSDADPSLPILVVKALPRRAVGFRSDTYPWLPVLVEEDLHRRAVGSRCDANPVIPIIVADKELSDGELAEGTVGSLDCTEHQQNYDQAGRVPLCMSRKRCFRLRFSSSRILSRSSTVSGVGWGSFTAFPFACEVCQVIDRRSKVSHFHTSWSDGPPESWH